MKNEKEKRLKIVVMAGVVLILLFMTTFVYAEGKELGKKEFFGIEFPWSIEYIGDSWIAMMSPGSTSIEQYGGLNFSNRDSAMLTANLLMSKVHNEKTLLRVSIGEDKNIIDRRTSTPFLVMARIFNNGEIFIEIADAKTGKIEYWIFK